MPWNREINTVLERSFEAGLTHYYMGRYVNLSKLRSKLVKGYPDKFQLKHVQGSFLVLIMGVVISAFVLLAEKAMFTKSPWNSVQSPRLQ